MLEAILTSGGSPLKEYPDSGPGVKTLKYGNEELGYFGEVSNEDLFDVTDLRREFNFWDGTDQTRPTWIKMFLDGKVLFFPIQRIVSALSYSQLYAAGLVYGTDNNGVYPLNPPVNQLKIITKGTDAFKVRLFKGGVDDPTVITGTTSLSASVPKLLESEFGRIYAALVAVNIPGYIGPKFQVYGAGALDVVQTQNTQQTNITMGLYYLKGVVNLYAKTTAGNSWFPVLELMPPGETPLLPIDNITPNTLSLVSPVIPKDVEFADELIPIIRASSGTISPLPIQGDSEIVGELPIPISTIPIRVDNTLPAWVVPATFTFE